MPLTISWDSCPKAPSRRLPFLLLPIHRKSYPALSSLLNTLLACKGKVKVGSFCLWLLCVPLDMGSVQPRCRKDWEGLSGTEQPGQRSLQATTNVSNTCSPMSFWELALESREGPQVKDAICKPGHCCSVSLGLYGSLSAYKNDTGYFSCHLTSMTWFNPQAVKI